MLGEPWAWCFKRSVASPIATLARLLPTWLLMWNTYYERNTCCCLNSESLLWGYIRKSGHQLETMSAGQDNTCFVEVFYFFVLFFILFFKDSDNCLCPVFAHYVICWIGWVGIYTVNCSVMSKSLAVKLLTHGKLWSEPWPKWS